MTQLSTAANAESAPAHGVSFAEALRVWTRVALLSFGGPTAQIAVMHHIIVDEKHWISESRFLYALNYCMLLPGGRDRNLPFQNWDDPDTRCLLRCGRGSSSRRRCCVIVLRLPGCWGERERRLRE